ncbi:TrbC/VirB2 family protein [Stenotrophomonas sp. C3(2023)]|uniref:TrbC/VirB2 family protein n=1 Tax=Stenotrophomonas sp. C3(2023) TaxID=3080277 RepID=UPI00293CC6D0|nr:TrbC/VirB2 family protein [Stenotrophomonas sp. C3(2023)]MDV3470161.1 TrbC/VirB2 family protein [Stenotrophomonas sp. C3(2023)]
MRHARPTGPRRAVSLLPLLLMLPLGASAQSGSNDTQEKFCGFLGNITSLLNIGSIGVVTIALMFAGYQIAFAHKRILDVMPIFVGAVLIGAAAQVAAMLIGSGNTCAS